MKKIYKKNILLFIFIFLLLVPINVYSVDINNIVIYENENNKEVFLENISTINDNVKEFLIEDEWIIVLTSENLSEKYFNGIYRKVLGVAVFKENAIYIDNNPTSIKKAIGHEIGHTIDYKYKWISNSQLFQDIYMEEKDIFKEIQYNKNIYDTKEYFAEVANLIFTNPELCMKNTPKSYGFVGTLIQNL